ncbi:MAG: thermostable hemolysin [Bdellovibrionota bacterium]
MFRLRSRFPRASPDRFPDLKSWNWAVSFPGPVRSAQGLLQIVPCLLWAMGYRYVLCTATNYVQRIMKQAGFEFVLVAKADPQRLDPASLPKWGRYYEHEPYTGWFSLDVPNKTALTLATLSAPTSLEICRV